MYTDHFQLNRAPFANVHDPHFLVLSDDQKKALSTLMHAIAQREGWALLLGQSGEGKTTLIMALLMKLSHEVISAVITNPSLDSLDFFNLLSLELGMEGPYSAKEEFLAAFRQYLAGCRAERKSVLLVVDEAQSIEPQLMEEIKLLGNQDEGPTKALAVILVAQPEFQKQLEGEKSKGLIQRLRRYHVLQPLSSAETNSYVRHRLSAAGANRDIFDDAALDALYRISRGNCRLINTLCDHALQLAYEQQRAIVTDDLVVLAANNSPELAIIGQAIQTGSVDSTGPAQGTKPDSPITLSAQTASQAEPDTLAGASSTPIESGPNQQAGSVPEATIVPPPIKKPAPPANRRVAQFDHSRDDYLDDFDTFDPELDEESYQEPKPGLIRRVAGTVFSLKGMAIMAGLILVAGVLFVSFGGVRYVKRQYWLYRRDSLIVVPEMSAPEQINLPAETGEPQKKRPPDWGPTLYIPTNSARAQGGGHG